MAIATVAPPARHTPPGTTSLRAAGVLAVRWLLLLGATTVTFHRSVSSVLADVGQGGLQYVPAVWIYAVVAAIWTHGRAARSIDIHDRETDVIVGLMCCGFAVLSATLLGEPLSGVFYLWRIDLLMMYVFTFGGSIVLFGLRRTLYYRWAWLVLLLGWPLVGRVVLYTIGDGRTLALAILHLAVVVFAQIQLRRPTDRGWFLAPALSAVVGMAMIPLLDLFDHPGRLVVPALTACGIGLAVPAVRVARARIRAAEPLLSWPTVQPPIVRRPWGAVIVLALITMLGAITIPPPPTVASPVAVPVDPAASEPGPIAPPGWRLVSDVDYPEPTQFFGSGATWRRYGIEATSSATEPDAVDPQGRYRTVMVDVLTTRRPRSLVTFPVVVTYPMGSLDLSGDESVRLRSGVTASVDAAVDTRQQLTWTLASFTIEIPSQLAVTDGVLRGEERVYQRVTLIAVDNHQPDAPFPEPTNALLDSIRAAAANIVRGSAGGGSSTAEAKDVDLLLVLADQILAQREAGAR